MNFNSESFQNQVISSISFKIINYFIKILIKNDFVSSNSFK